MVLFKLSYFGILIALCVTLVCKEEDIIKLIPFLTTYNLIIFVNRFTIFFFIQQANVSQPNRILFVP